MAAKELLHPPLPAFARQCEAALGRRVEAGLPPVPPPGEQDGALLSLPSSASSAASALPDSAQVTPKKKQKP